MARVFLSSIRFKIFVLYVVFLFLTLAFFNFFLYLEFRETLERKVDALLDAKVQAVESAVRTSWETQAKAEVAGPKINWFAEIFGGAPKKTDPDIDPYESIIRYLTQDGLSPNPDEAKIFLDIFGTDGRVVYSSHPDPRIQALEPSVLRRVLAQKRLGYVFRFRADPERWVPHRAVAKAISVGGQAKNIVQARVSTKPLQNQIRAFMVSLFLRSLIVIALASGGSFLLVRFTLRPVDQMTRTIRGIRPENLDRRIETPRTADEIARLAETFNAMLERLEKSFRSQKQIVQDISHELKTPLTIIRGEFEVVLKRRRPPEEYEEILRSSLEEIEKVRRIIDNLLLLARFDNPSHAMDMKGLELNRVLEGLVQDARILGREKNIEISLTLRDHVPVYGNDVHLDRLFRNLLDNAVKYNVVGGRVRVTVENENGMAKITVEDTGVGIPAGEQGKVFDRFYRTDRARSSGDGFGLGLSISKSIVEAHHGTIDVQSRPGKGAVFCVRLPMARDDRSFWHEAAAKKAHAFIITHSPNGGKSPL